MFLFDLKTKILLACIFVLVPIGGYYIYEYHRRGSEIIVLKTEIANYKAVLRVNAGTKNLSDETIAALNERLIAQARNLDDVCAILEAAKNADDGDPIGTVLDRLLTKRQ